MSGTPKVRACPLCGLPIPPSWTGPDATHPVNMGALSPDQRDAWRAGHYVGGRPPVPGDNLAPGEYPAAMGDDS